MKDTKWYAKSLEEVAAKTDIVNGLTDAQIEASREKYGMNKLAEAKGRSFMMRLLDQFKDVTIIILLVAALISGIVGEHADAILIFAIVALNALIGMIQEDKAEKSLKALQDMSTPTAKVIRGGEEQTINSKDVVVGDLVVMDAGDLVPADLRIVQSNSLTVQEASLTGESVPVEKHADVVCADDAVLGDRKNMAYSSGMVSYGRGQGVVVAVGMDTEVGKIATMLTETKSDPTPLQQQLNQLGKILGIGAIVACGIILLVGVLNNHDFLQMFLTIVSLAVAVVPESLPPVATIVLALGVQRLVERHAIVRNLPSVETLGSATVICSDKTGTLTQNVMTVKEHWTESDVNELSRGLLLCNDARKVDGNWLGDPTETALSAWAEALDLDAVGLIQKHTRLNEVPFDSGRKRMSTINDIDGDATVFVKGGVDEVLAVVTQYQDENGVRAITQEDIERIQKNNQEMGVKALRVLALAKKAVSNTDLEATEIESELTFVGLVGMIDPPRPEVTEAIKTSKKAGIRVVTITGDHAVTASAIGREIGLLEDGQRVISGKELDAMTDDELFEQVQHIGVYARVSPEHKMRIISAWKRHGDIVAMTGDGVNDAPALKRADIGAAMGIVGTEVAKGAADMVLTDDNFATVVTAIGEGRRIKDNIMKAISYLLSCNVGELLLLLIAVLLDWDAPLLPIHLLWINLVTDSLPALALGVDGAEDGIMERQPDRTGSLISKSMLWRIGYQGAVVGGVALFAYMYGAGRLWAVGDTETGTTMAFIVLAFSQLIHSYSIHSSEKSVFTSFWKNKYLIMATLINGLMILAVLFIPVLNDLFKLGTLDGHHWMIVVMLMFVPMIIVEIMKLLKLNGKH
ncbi:calcium-translocating P-type ATPase, PMCA-type [Erysipelothrix rhusiopathiae]|uniref:calcium-translocating P-type ATPase, PMCA-type n=1 Tax=Erysipelothrix rhusiopathiae TaxID=1648 RepID=UPI002B245AFB|nr:calcium-translocating P-type ATPase, PMCA-type [Erysipelothrix rhusiopathiae]WRB93504.1 calcium-translocating P-type ATPase, PMCA-type [Erysipelothrix rhusiopathiae]